MLLHFWGVRGSISAPLRNEQIQSKIAAVVSRMTPKDVESEEAKMRFLSSLPDWLYGTVGGNTPCVELRSKNGEVFLLDCGTGLRSYSVYGKQPENLHYNIFMSHFHWDHIQGLPFFGQTFNPNTTIDVYSVHPNAEQCFAAQSSPPFFPPNACWPNIRDRFTFHQLEEGVPFEIDGVKINTHRMTHPGDSYSYSFEEDGKKFIYGTDVELQPSDFNIDIQRNYFFKDADVILFDCQYTSPEAIQKINWGHSSFSSAIDFASIWNIKDLYFFHHEPNYDDKKLDSILYAGQNYKKFNADNRVGIHISREGQEIEI